MLAGSAGRAARRILNAAPRRFMAEDASASSRDPSKLLLNFLVPSASILKEVEVVSMASETKLQRYSIVRLRIF